MSGTTLTEGDMLLRDICLHPDDPVARLIYADWLEDEAGQQERARIIRAEVERDGTINCARIGVTLRSDEKRTKLWWSRRLEDEVVRHLLGEALYHLAVQGQEIDWLAIHRGFVHVVGIRMAAFMKHAGAIFAEHPITTVQITDREPRGGTSWVQGIAPAAEADAARGYHVPDEIVLGTPEGDTSEVTEGANVMTVHTYSPGPLLGSTRPSPARAALNRGCLEYGRKQRGWRGGGGEDDDRPAD
jgi:uncharacterized protein (TIGR02996 family)